MRSSLPLALVFVSACGSRTGVDIFGGAPVDTAVVDAGADVVEASSDASEEPPAPPDSASDAPVVCETGLVKLASQQYNPSTLVVDATSVYWLDQYAVVRIPKCGGAAVTLKGIPGQSEVGLVVDATSVYWGERHTILKVPLGGGQPTTLASGQAYPSGSFAIDSTFIYWTNGGADGTGESDGHFGTVMKTPIAGGTPTTLAANQIDIFGLALGADRIYWSDGAIFPQLVGTLLSVPTSGGAPTTLASSPSSYYGMTASYYALTADATNLYWSSNNRGAISLLRMPLGGGTPVTLTSVAYRSPLARTRRTSTSSDPAERS